VFEINNTYIVVIILNYSRANLALIQFDTADSFCESLFLFLCVKKGLGTGDPVLGNLTPLQFLGVAPGPVALTVCKSKK
jgi:hypothetical protein